MSRVPLERPGAGSTAERHRAIFAAAREDISLAKLIEAHWDAVAILEEAGLTPPPDATYGVWAAGGAGQALVLQDDALRGTKEFCSGAALVDRALVTAGTALVEVDLRADPGRLRMDEAGWQTDAFRMTRTAAITFNAHPIVRVVGEDDWYLQRIGFWQGACGPAAAWAGGAAGLLDFARQTSRDDPHTVAHLGAMHADVWAMQVLLAATGDAFDAQPAVDAMVQALQLRHIVEQQCTDVLLRFGRALGPAPLIKNADVARRYAELELFLRQCHAERDLEALGKTLRS